MDLLKTLSNLKVTSQEQHTGQVNTSQASLRQCYTKSPNFRIWTPELKNLLRLNLRIIREFTLLDKVIGSKTIFQLNRVVIRKIALLRLEKISSIK